MSMNKYEANKTMQDLGAMDILTLADPNQYEEPLKDIIKANGLELTGGLMDFALNVFLYGRLAEMRSAHAETGYLYNRIIEKVAELTGTDAEHLKKALQNEEDFNAWDINQFRKFLHLTDEETEKAFFTVVQP